jgi:Fe-Mn family superoxide dismutase
VIKFIDLPFKEDALEPVISAETIKFHYEKHHRGYFNKTLELISGTALENKSLDAIIDSAKSSGDHVLFNNAAQVFNHDLYWKSLAAHGSADTKLESGLFLSAINRCFGSLEKLKENLKKNCMSRFGSGWIWLVFDKNHSDENEKLQVLSTANGEIPVGVLPLLTIDVWEHAYYIDYRNRRAEYAEKILGNDKAGDHGLLNWQHARKIYDER